ncbi:MAG: helix-turn-helix domain-containing protein, partial [Leadbetterella sp.]
MNISEAADYLGISESSLYTMCSQRKIA